MAVWFNFRCKYTNFFVIIGELYEKFFIFAQKFD